MKLFEINRRIELAVSMANQAPYYHSRIEDITEDLIIVAMPISKGSPVHINVGSSVYGKVIVDTAVYHFRSELLMKKFQPLPIWVLSEPKEIKKIQHRAFVRVSAMLPVSMKVIENKEDQVIETEIPCISTRDISGGGVLVIAKETVALGSKVNLAIDLSEFGSIQLTGRVVRVSRANSEEPVFWLGVQFLNLTEKDRAQLIQFTFKKQVEIRRRTR